jgi:hypothetical protein
MLVGRALPRHDLGDGHPFGLCAFARAGRIPGGLRLHQVEQGGRPGQAAHVRGTDAIGASLHNP